VPDGNAPQGSGSPGVHLGHFASWGAVVAGQLTQAHKRYTEMTRANIRFLPQENRICVVGGADGILPLAWPADARLHHDDIARFRGEFGAPLTAALRLGYTYRLGPLGEWIFFESAAGAAACDPPPAPWCEEWDAPPADLTLGTDCRLDDARAEQLTNLGAALRKEHRLAAAKRCFMRCHLAAVAEWNEPAMAVALGNLATVFVDEGRWMRVLALAIAASFFTTKLPNEGREWLVSLGQRAHSCLDPETNSQMINAARERAQLGSSLLAVLWALEDMDLDVEIARRRC